MKKTQAKAKRVSKKINPNTGKPRKWICLNHSGIDYALEIEEAIYHYAYLAGKLKDAGKIAQASPYYAMPLGLLRRMIDEREGNLLYMATAYKERLDAVVTFTEAEARYCEAEGIPKEDYLARKAALK